MFEAIESNKNKYFGLIGFIYGLVLAILSVGAVGDGHGTYLLMVIYSAPFGFLPVPLVIIGTIVLWLIVGLLIKVNQKKLLFLLLAIHYVGMYLLLKNDVFDEQEQLTKILDKSPDYFIFGYLVYGAGQFVIWFYLIFVRTKTETIVEI